MLVAITAIAIGLTAIVSMGRKSMNISPALRRNAELQTKGVYRFVRHPMYTAVLIFCGTYVLPDLTVHGGVLWLSLVLVLRIKIYYEERMLKMRFPGYGQYASRVKRLIPYLY